MFVAARPTQGQRLNCPHCLSVFRCAIAKDESPVDPAPKAATGAPQNGQRPTSAATPTADTFGNARVDFAEWHTAAKGFSRIATVRLGEAADHAKTFWNQSSQRSRYTIVSVTGLFLAMFIGSLGSDEHPEAKTLPSLTGLPVATVATPPNNENSTVRYGDESRMSDLVTNEPSPQATRQDAITWDLPPAIPAGINLKNQDAPPELIYEILERIMSSNFLDQAYALKGVEAVSTRDQQRLVKSFATLLEGCNERYRLLLRADAIGDFRIDDEYESDLDTSSGRMRVIFQAEALAYGLYLTQLPEAAEVLHGNVDNPVYGQMVYDYATAIESNRRMLAPEHLQALISRIQ